MESLISPVDGIRIAYRVFERDEPGAVAGVPAPTVVVVHGTALSQAIWRGFGYVRALTSSHRVITVDLRGHGRSEGPHDLSSYGMPAFVADVIAVLDRHGVAAADYVGYSLGGRVGFSIAATHPHRLKRFVSIAGAPGTTGGAFDRVFFPGCVDVLRHSGMEGFLNGWQNWTGHPLDPATRLAFARNDPHALVAYMTRSDDDPGVDDTTLNNLTLPVLQIVGSQDTERLVAAEHVTEVLPGAQLLVIDGANHGGILRDPACLVATEHFIRPSA